MRRLIGLVGLLTIAGTLTAKAAGPVYTIPADYEKMKKVIEGLAGTTNLNALSDTQARNAGANVKSFVEGATGRSTTSTYSPSYFRAYGNNYRQFVANAAATDPGATTNAARFTNAGRNYRNLAQGMTGLGITDSRYYYYGRAGTNVRNLAEGETGLSIRDWRYWYFRNAGVNYRTVAQGLANGQWIGTNPYSRYNNFQQYKIQQFKQRADQVFYDTYINPNGLKKTFSSLSSAVTTKTAGLTPITRYNRVSGLGGDAIVGFMSSVEDEVRGEFYFYFDDIKSLKGYYWKEEGRRGKPRTFYLYDPEGNIACTIKTNLSSVNFGYKTTYEYLDSYYCSSNYYLLASRGFFNIDKFQIVVFKIK